MEQEAPVEGLLYTFGASRFGGTYCHLLYVVLAGRYFSLYRNRGDEVPVRSGILDLVLRVEDTGRQEVNGQTLYTLRLYNVADTSKDFLLGASRSEETAAWIDAISNALTLPILDPKVASTAHEGNGMYSSGQPSDAEQGGLLEPLSRTASEAPEPLEARAPRPSPGISPSPPLEITVRRPSYTQLTTIGAAAAVPLMRSTPEVRAASIQVPPSEEAVSTRSATASKWRLVKCSNSLRFFEEINGTPFVHTFYKLPVMKCVGVVKSPPDAIFDLVINFGEERLQWDSSIDSGTVVERIDGHTDILHLKLRHDWIWLRPRDLCLSRYWNREENGRYLVFFKSVEHPKCPPCRNTVRATIHSGGYIISPLKSSAQGKPRSLVEHVLEIDAGGWSSFFGIGLSPYPAHLRNGLLGTVAGIREYFAAQRVNSSNTVVQRHLVDASELPHAGSISTPRATAGAADSTTIPSFLDSEDVDEFFDATNDVLSDTADQMADWMGIVVEGGIGTGAQLDVFPDYLTGMWPLSNRASGIDWARYCGSVSRGPLRNGENCWSQPDGSLFNVRSKTFLEDGSRAPAGEPSCNLVAVDWLGDASRMDHVARRQQNLVQRISRRYGESGGPFFIVINMQVPQGEGHISLVFYFASDAPIPEASLLYRFIHGDDAFRNSRITLIAAVPEGSWLVKQAVGSRPVPLGQIMELKYYSGPSYLEVDVNMGSSSVVRGIMGLVFGYITNLVVDMAFLLKAETEEELPERLIGAARCSHIELESVAPPPPEF